MFEKIAKFRLLGARRMAPEPSQIVPANDNLLGGGRPGRHRPSLVCRWTFDQGPRCHWEVVGEHATNPLLTDQPPEAVSFTQPSSCCRTTDGTPRRTTEGGRLRPSRICCRRVTSGQESVAGGDSHIAIASHSQLQWT